MKKILLVQAKISASTCHNMTTYVIACKSKMTTPGKHKIK